MSALESKYTPFDSIEQMLAPETLSELLDRLVSHVEIRPMVDHGGLAGSKFSCVETDGGRFVLKRMSMKYDYLMFTSNDKRCRAMRLWQYGLLDELRPHLHHKIIACGRDGDGWGMLMHDLSKGLFSQDNRIPKSLLTVFLDRLAQLHARFWNDPRLMDPRVGLGDVTTRLNTTSLRLAQKQNGDQRGVLSTWVREGWEILETILEPDIFQPLSRLNENPQPLLEVLERYPYTLVHGDYRDANLAYLEPDQAVVFDWHWASRSLMTIDLAWFTRGDYFQNAMEKTEATGYYRDRLETYLGSSFDDDTWQTMLELGQLVDAFMNCFPAYWSKYSKKPERRAYRKMEIKKQIQSIRDGLRWL